MATTQKFNGAIKAAQTLVREEDLEDMRKLMGSLQDSIDRASNDGRLVMMGVYVELLALVSAKVGKIEARFKREMLANFRHQHKDMKMAQKAAAGDESEE